MVFQKSKMLCDIFFVFYMVSLTRINVAEKVDYLEPNLGAREKRQDDRWIWGYADIPTTETYIDTKSNNKVVLNETTEAPKRENPCLIPDPPMPDFSSPGRRISEIKCYQYIWNIKLREKQNTKRLDCESYLKETKAEGVVFQHGGIGGYNARRGAFPHMAAIGWKSVQGTWIVKCGGTLISAKFVLTAAHCTRALSSDTTIADPVPKVVRLGDYASDIDLWFYENISRIIPHPQYNPPKKYFDIALMELERAKNFSFVTQPACLWGNLDTSPIGTTANWTGWGVLKVGSRRYSPKLQVGEVDIINTDQCNILLKQFCNRLWCGVNDTQICAGKLAGGVDACQGDSGGPLTVKIPLPKSPQGVMHYIIGVTSFGFSCAVANRPGIYTRVADFIDWIEPIVWPTVSSP